MIDQIATDLFSVFLFGSVQGAVFSLLALGFSLVYGVGGVLNLAHGGFYLASMYTFYWCIAVWELTVLMSIIITLIVVVIICILAFVLLIKPLQDSIIAILIVTFALAFFFEQLVKVLPWSDNLTHWVPTIIEGAPIEIFGINFPVRYFWTIIGAIILIIIIYLFINKFKLGKSIRAVAQDREAAQLMGINANLIIMVTIIISGLLVAVATFLYGAGEEVFPSMGWGFLTQSFAIVVLGGMGSIPGSVLGAFLIGYARTFCSYFIGTQFAEIFPIIIIILMLLFRPQGILGKKEVE
ncbi:MAG: branched-chain amino acid ABC transporter permease [Promethearchaeota archaeon]